MYYYILECEFGWVNYALNESEIESVVDSKLDYKFKQGRKTIYEGADIYKSLEHEAWKQRCQTLLRTFFHRAGQFSGITTYLDTRFTVQGKPWENVINTLIYWCTNSNSGHAENNQDDPPGLITRNYDLKNHLRFCGITDDEIKATLRFNSSEKKIKVLENIQRFLVFNPSEKIILIIRVTRSGHHEQLKAEVYHFLLKDKLKHSGVIVTGLVVRSGENSHSESFCIDCDNFIVSSKIFNSGQEFDNFWKIFVSQNTFKMFGWRLEAREKNSKATLFEAVTSKMIGYLAHLQFKMFKKTCFTCN